MMNSHKKCYGKIEFSTFAPFNKASLENSFKFMKLDNWDKKISMSYFFKIQSD